MKPAFFISSNCLSSTPLTAQAPIESHMAHGSGSVRRPFINEETGEIDDYSLLQIRQYGIHALLKSHVPLSYFLLFLLHEQSSEALFFYLEIELYRTHSYKSDVEKLIRAQRIYKTFIEKDALVEINIDGSLRMQITTALESSLMQKAVSQLYDNLLYLAQNEMFPLLSGGYVKWTSRPASFHKMSEDLNWSVNVYSREKRRIAASRILQFFDDLNNKICAEDATAASSGAVSPRPLNAADSPLCYAAPDAFGRGAVRSALERQSPVNLSQSTPVDSQSAFKSRSCSPSNSAFTCSADDFSRRGNAGRQLRSSVEPGPPTVLLPSKALLNYYRGDRLRLFYWLCNGFCKNVIGLEFIENDA